MTSAGAKISVLFEPAAELTSRLNDEKEFRFVEVPTPEGQQDAESGETPSDPGTNTDTPDTPENPSTPGTGGGGSTGDGWEEG